MKFPKMRWLIMFVLIAQSNANAAVNSGAKTPQKISPEALDEVLWWLPEDTELVASIQSNDAKTIFKTSIAGVGLGGAGRGQFVEQLARIPVARIVEGSRKFRDTGGFGLMPFEGCSIIDLQSDLPKDHALLQWLAKNARRTETIAGYKTFIFNEKLEQDQWNFLIVHLRPNVLLCATNQNYLESVLRRRLRNADEREKTVRALPATLPEWKYVDTKSTDWAVRHFRKDQARFDPTSPFYKHTFLPDNDAIGITYSLNTKQNVAAVHYLTSPRNTASMAKEYKQFWASLIDGMGGVSDSAGKWRPEIATQPNGVIKMAFSFIQPELTDTVGMFSLGLLALMGHAIVV